MLSQSQTNARDLAEQMGQRLKVTEAMLAETVEARARLVADNESAVEGLLATVRSKDQLLKVLASLRDQLECFHPQYICGATSHDGIEQRKCSCNDNNISGY